MIEAIKLANVGAGCTGKTTFVEEFRRVWWGNYHVVPEAARSWFGNHPEVQDSERFSFEVQSEIQALALRRERFADIWTATGCRKVISCDRSVYDAAVYVAAQGDDEGAAQLLARVGFWLPTYTKVFLHDPTDVAFETDAVRQEGDDTRWRFHETFEEFFDKYGVPYETLSGPVEERLARVEDYIADLLPGWGLKISGC